MCSSDEEHIKEIPCRLDDDRNKQYFAEAAYQIMNDTLETNVFTHQRTRAPANNGVISHRRSEWCKRGDDDIVSSSLLLHFSAPPYARNYYFRARYATNRANGAVSAALFRRHGRRRRSFGISGSGRCSFV